MPEKPIFSPAERAAESQRESPLDRSIDGLNAALGPKPGNISEDDTYETITEKEKELRMDGNFAGFRELALTNALMHERSGRYYDSVNDPARTPESAAAVQAHNDARTSYEYITSVLEDSADTLGRYKQLRGNLDVIPPEVAEQEKHMEAVLTLLNKTLRERTAAANVQQLRLMIGDSSGDPAARALAEKRLSVALQSADLSDQTREILKAGDQQAIFEKSKQLSQSIVGILSGTVRPPGVPPDFSLLKPTYTILLITYKELAAFERDVALDSDLSPEERQQKYADLQAQKDGVRDELVKLSDTMAIQHAQRLEMSIVRNRFDALPIQPNHAAPARSLNESTVEDLRNEAASRATFHAERFRTFDKTMRNEVLSPGLLHNIEDFSNQHGREAMRDITGFLSRMISSPLPEAFGIEKAAKDWLSEPIQNALGWPEGKETWEELTPQEQQRVTEKMKSIKDAINAFDQTTLDRMLETVSLIEGLQSEQVDSQELARMPLPAERVTSANYEQLKKQHGVGAVSAMLFNQLNGDIGSGESGTGVMGQYAKLLTDINDVCDGHIDVAQATKTMQERYFTMAKSLLAAAGGLLLTPAMIAALTALFVARKPIGMVLRGAGNAAKGGAKLGWRVARGTARVGYKATASSLQWLRRKYGPRTGAYLQATKDQLTKLRYFQKERQVTSMLAKSKAGQRVMALKSVQKLLGASKVGANIAGKSLSALAWGVGPAIGLYQAYGLEAEAQATDNQGLKDALHAQERGIGYETVGIAAAGFLSAGPGIVLAAPVLYAGNHAQNRDALHADWQRQPEDWKNYGDGAMLLQRAATMTDESAVNAAGGGLLPSRIEGIFWGQKDFDEAFKLISNNNRMSREAIVEGYLKQYAGADTAYQIDAMRYIKKATAGEFRPIYASVLQQADAYALLCSFQRGSQQRGEPMFIEYQDFDGVEKKYDLANISLDENPQKIVRIYKETIEPVSDIVRFEAIADIAKNAPEVARQNENANAAKRIRQEILAKSLHRVWDSERNIRNFNISDGEKNILRSLIASEMKSKLDSIVPVLMQGEMSPEDYATQLNGFESILGLVSAPENIPFVLAHAKNVLGTQYDTAANIDGNPIIDLFSQ